MDDNRKRSMAGTKDQEIVYSQAIKAGKRIYYLDVKRNRKDELFLAITESKKIVSGSVEDPRVEFEKHKIFLYKEDFQKFLEGIQGAIGYIGNYNADALVSDSDDEKFISEIPELVIDELL